MTAGSGRFITIEGGDGSGKSTQAALLEESLIAEGLQVLLTREPGGTEGAEQIRGLLVEGSTQRWDAWSEALLVYAARCDHVVRVITPALAAGRWVICDRFVHSTLAYQGHVGGLGEEPIKALHSLALGRLWPDLVLVLDLPADVGLARAAERGGAARFEARGATFHESLRQAFLTLANAEPGRCRLIDATGSREAVQAKVMQSVRQSFAFGHKPS